MLFKILVHSTKHSLSSLSVAHCLQVYNGSVGFTVRNVMKKNNMAVNDGKCWKRCFSIVTEVMCVRKFKLYMYGLLKLF